MGVAKELTHDSALKPEKKSTFNQCIKYYVPVDYLMVVESPDWVAAVETGSNVSDDVDFVSVLLCL